MLVSAGDVPARELSAAAGLLRMQRPSLRIRYVHINDLTVLGTPATWPSGLSDASYRSLFGQASIETAARYFRAGSAEQAAVVDRIFE